jgi:hypothetical protein
LSKKACAGILRRKGERKINMNIRLNHIMKINNLKIEALSIIDDWYNMNPENVDNEEYDIIEFISNNSLEIFNKFFEMFLVDIKDNSEKNEVTAAMEILIYENFK